MERLQAACLAAGFKAALSEQIEIDIDDIVQDTFMVVARRFDEISVHPNPIAYVLLIAKRLAADRRKAERSRSAKELNWHLGHSRHLPAAAPGLR